MLKNIFTEDTRVFIKNKALNVTGVLFILAGATVLFTILTYSPNNPSLNTVVTNDFFIELYSLFVTADLLKQCFGNAAFVIPTSLVYYGIKLFLNIGVSNPFRRLLATILMTFALGIMLNYNNVEYSIFGGILATKLKTIHCSSLYMNFAMGTVLIILWLYSFNISIISLFKTLSNKLVNNWNDHDYVDWSLKRPKIAIRETRKTLPTGPETRRKRLPNNSIYMLPPLELLKQGQSNDTKLNKSYYEQQSVALLKALNDFGITGTITDVRSGPVVSLFEFEPSAGIKSSRIISLSSDISRSISATSVRVAIMPGRNVIGIEVPNEKRKTVYLREILSSSSFEKFHAPLAIALGKSIEGDPVVVDLAQMPHLLVAGTTGSGKSVAINTMILSLLYRLSPESCKLIMIDPKMLELSVYEGIPHLLTPVVTDSKKAVCALKWAVKEMERRYHIMSKLGVRNIYGYNEKINLANKKGDSVYREMQVGFDDRGAPIIEKEYLENELFPNIVIVVDEMADLMIVAGKEIESAVQRLAQMARAAGIHLIMATQRPSVDVITGTIKANFPTRITFHVSSKIDSRTILGEQGAEQLLGKGDMLYMANASSISRIHGPFVSDEEVETVVKYLHTQGKPSYAEDITTVEDDPYTSDETDSITDELYNEAKSLIFREGKASTSFIQRHLKIGYNRAARIIDQMEKSNLISKPDHVGRRKIIG